MNFIKRFIKHRLDFSFQWSKTTTWRFHCRPWKNFYCYVWPQRCTHSSVIRTGTYVVTHTDYFWLNMMLVVDNCRPITY